MEKKKGKDRALIIHFQGTKRRTGHRLSKPVREKGYKNRSLTTREGIYFYREGRIHPGERKAGNIQSKKGHSKPSLTGRGGRKAVRERGPTARKKNMSALL